MKYCIRCLISGRVQGVFFRAFTQREAERLGLEGWVRNLHDGRVEVMACGEEGGLRVLQKWLKHGSPQAEVEEVEFERLAYQSLGIFRVR